MYIINTLEQAPFVYYNVGSNFNLFYIFNIILSFCNLWLSPARIIEVYLFRCWTYFLYSKIFILPGIFHTQLSIELISAEIT